MNDPIITSPYALTTTAHSNAMVGDVLFMIFFIFFGGGDVVFLVGARGLRFRFEF